MYQSSFSLLLKRSSRYCTPLFRWLSTWSLREIIVRIFDYRLNLHERKLRKRDLAKFSRFVFLEEGKEGRAQKRREIPFKSSFRRSRNTESPTVICPFNRLRIGRAGNPARVSRYRSKQRPRACTLVFLQTVVASPIYRFLLSLSPPLSFHLSSLSVFEFQSSILNHRIFPRDKSVYIYLKRRLIPMIV